MTRREKLKYQIISIMFSAVSAFLTMFYVWQLFQQPQWITLFLVILLVASAKLNYDNCFLLEKEYQSYAKISSFNEVDYYDE